MLLLSHKYFRDICGLGSCSRPSGSVVSNSLFPASKQSSLIQLGKNRNSLAIPTDYIGDRALGSITICSTTQLCYLPFVVCKPDQDVAFSAVIFDCGTDIRHMIESYVSAKVWLTVQVRYELANPKDEKINRSNSTLSAPQHGSFAVSRQSVKTLHRTSNRFVSFSIGYTNWIPRSFWNILNLCSRAFFSLPSAKCGKSIGLDAATASFLRTSKANKP